MVILIRTDKPESFIGIHDGNDIVSGQRWETHRELSDKILKVIEGQVKSQDLTWNDIDGIVVFKGPGSFTGLRIGVTVANTLAESLGVPVVGVQGDEWVESGITRINNNDADKIVMPEYGGHANITKPRK